MSALIRRAAFITLLISLALLLSPQPTRAHGYLVRSIPQDRSVVAHSPARVQIWFSEGLEPKFSSLTVTNQTGQRVDLGEGGVVPGNRSQLSVRLAPELPDGAYVATMRVAFSSDGHITTDTLVFWVGQQGANIAVSGATQETYPLEVLARALVIGGLLIAFGVLFAYRVVLVPAWRNPTYRAGWLAPRILDRLTMLALIGLGAALIGSVIWLMQQSMALFAANLGRMLGEGLWLSVLNGTQFGDYWKVRFILTGIAALILIAAQRARTDRPALVYPLWSTALLVTSAASGLLSLSGHPAGATLWALPTVAIDWLHWLSSAAWVGGLIGIVWVLRPALDRLPIEGQRLALLAVLRRFSPLAAYAVALVSASGLYSATIQVYLPEQMVTTDYGRTLFTKLLLVAPLLLLGLIHYLALRPERFQKAASWLPSTLRAEVAFGLSVVLIVALLTATPPPTPPNARASASPPTFSVTEGDLALTLTPNPGAVGANSYDVRLTLKGQPLERARVRLRLVLPSLGRSSPSLELDAVGGGLYAGAGSELTRPGTWQALFDVTPESIPNATRLALVWNVPTQADQGTGREPGWLNWIALLAVLAALIGSVGPPLARRVRAMQLEPQAVAVGVGAAILTVIVLVGGGIYLSGTVRALEQAGDVPPLHVNPTLPDQASLRAGQTIYQANCASCHAQPPADKLGSRTDSATYQFLQGTTSHPYGGALSEAERWALVNFLRSQTP